MNKVTSRLQHKKFKWLLATTVAIMISACGGGSDNEVEETTNYTVTSTAGANGSIDPTSTIVDDGDTATFAITADSGYQIDSVSGCSGSLSGNTYTTGAVNADCTVTVSFAIAPGKGMSGVFVISETQGGFVEQTMPCEAPSTQKATRTVGISHWYLCTTAATDPTTYQRTMDSTWTNPAITGVFIRLKWSDLQTDPNTYDDTILLREVDKAVANGKLYSIGIKSGAENGATPRWLFEPVSAGGAGLTPVILDWNEDSNSCNTPPHSYGDPTDPVYRELYLNMLSHVAEVLQQDDAKWRSLAYVKISGANSRSAENRLPNECKVGSGCICNNKEWANAGYTPDGLFTFYQEQMARIAGEFPGKSMSYSLIQAGFPRVNNEGCYLDGTNTNICQAGINTAIVGPFTQTESIINYARTTYGDDVAIAHLGLGQAPDFSDTSRYADGTACPLPLDTDGNFAHGPNGVGSGCPNRWVTEVSDVGGLTHFQTNNPKGVATMAELDSALNNMWLNSNSAMLEIYEARAWEANDSVLDPTLPMAEQRTLAHWNQRLHERRIERVE